MNQAVAAALMRLPADTGSGPSRVYVVADIGEYRADREVIIIMAEPRKRQHLHACMPPGVAFRTGLLIIRAAWNAKILRPARTRLGAWLRYRMVWR